MILTSIFPPDGTSPSSGRAVNNFFSVYTHLNLAAAFPLLLRRTLSMVSISILSSMKENFNDYLLKSICTGSMDAVTIISNICLSLIMYFMFCLTGPNKREHNVTSNPPIYPEGIIYGFKYDY